MNERCGVEAGETDDGLSLPLECLEHAGGGSRSAAEGRIAMRRGSSSRAGQRGMGVDTAATRHKMDGTRAAYCVSVQEQRQTHK